MSAFVCHIVTLAVDWVLETSYLQFLSSFEDVPLVEFQYLVFTPIPGESRCRRLGSLLLCLCDVHLLSAN